MSSPRLTFSPYAWAGLGALPVLIWWLGWYPGFGSSDTIGQWGEVLHGPITNNHPAIHTLFLELFSLGGRYPGLVSLVQLILFGVLLVYGARVLVRAGIPVWLAVGAAWLLGLSPALAPTTLTLWKDIPFGLAFLWVWIELLGLAIGPPPPASPGSPPTSGGRSEREGTTPPAAPDAHDAPLPPAFGRGTPPASGGRRGESGGRSLWPPVRLGLALALLWLVRGNGPLTVLPILLLVVWLGWKQWRKPLITVGTLLAVVVLVTGPLYAAADVVRVSAVPAQVFLADVAASYNAEPETFTEEDVAMLETVAPLSIWTSRYDCDESTPLVFDPQFDHGPIRQAPGEWLELEMDILLRDPDSVIAHRACVSSYLYLPWTPETTFMHTPPYAIPENDVGLVREPISDTAFAITDWYWKFAEDYPWLFWRPATVIWPALAAIVVFAFRARRLLIPSTLFLAHLVNVTLTSPAQEFRYAYPLYLVAVLTITLLWPVLRGPGADQEVETGGLLAQVEVDSPK